VRGSIPTPEAAAMTYGGNTPCVEIQYGNQAPLILDAGSGVRRLGIDRAVQANGHSTEAHVLFSHFHWDHIQGLPFFAPLYDPNCSVTFYSTHQTAHLKSVLKNQMKPPYFPVDFAALEERLRYCRIDPGGITWREVCIKPFPLRHPGGCTGYRIQSPASCIVYASDHEHGDESYDAILREHSANADLLIYDAQYTPEEYKNRQGWGHSTWHAGARIAREAGVRQLLLFHHDPTHDDPALDKIVNDARFDFENTIAAREGAVFNL
jgi:phosphoribosyl 1,2-cyclic phosphodiesterase